MIALKNFLCFSILSFTYAFIFYFYVFFYSCILDSCVQRALMPIVGSWPPGRQEGVIFPKKNPAAIGNGSQGVIFSKRPFPIICNGIDRLAAIGYICEKNCKQGIVFKFCFEFTYF
jgi:hypothetical protein